MKTLRINRFGESILSDIEPFTYKINTISRDTAPEHQNNPDKYNLIFDWIWNDYNGVGKIEFYLKNLQLRNEFGDNFSYMQVNSESKRKQENGRRTCSLYNDPSLVQLFEKILVSVDFDLLGVLPVNN